MCGHDSLAHFEFFPHLIHHGSASQNFKNQYLQNGATSGSAIFKQGSEHPDLSIQMAFKSIQNILINPIHNLFSTVPIPKTTWETKMKQLQKNLKSMNASGNNLHPSKVSEGQWYQLVPYRGHHFMKCSPGHRLWQH